MTEHPLIRVMHVIDRAEFRALSPDDVKVMCRLCDGPADWGRASFIMVT